MKNLVGIDSASWTAAWTAAKAADTAAAASLGFTPNQYSQFETTNFTSTSKFQQVTVDGEYNLEVATPLVLTGQVFDFEIIYGLQTPRWTGPVTFPNGLPPGLSQEPAPGGIRVYSASPLPNPLKIKIKGTPGATQIRIGLTDVLHKSWGYTMAASGTVIIPVDVHVSAITGTYRHIGPGNSEVYGTATIVNGANQPVAGASVSMTRTFSGSTTAPLSFTTNASGVASYVFPINSYGNHTVTVTNVTGANLVYVAAQNVVSSLVVNVGP